MYAIAFDLVVAETQKHHPKGVTQAYNEIGAILASRGFEWKQGSLYVTENEDMATLFMAIQDLRARPWFPKMTQLSVSSSQTTPYLKSRMQDLTQQVNSTAFESEAQKLRWLLREGAAVLIQLDFKRVYSAIWESQLKLLFFNKTADPHAVDHHLWRRI